jgi:hypothetical protein
VKFDRRCFYASIFLILPPISRHPRTLQRRNFLISPVSSAVQRSTFSRPLSIPLASTYSLRQNFVHDLINARPWSPGLSVRKSSFVLQNSSPFIDPNKEESEVDIPAVLFFCPPRHNNPSPLRYSYGALFSIFSTPGRQSFRIYEIGISRVCNFNSLANTRP